MRSEAEDPRVNVTTVTRRASDLLRAKHENSTALVQNFLTDGTVLVHDSSNRGKGSPTYVDLGTDLGGADGKKMIVIMVCACQMHPSLLFNSLT